jgi:hypothetical protein
MSQNKQNLLFQVKLSNEAGELMNNAISYDVNGKLQDAFENYLNALEIYKKITCINFTREESFDQNFLFCYLFF